MIDLMQEGYGSHGTPVGLYEGFRQWQKARFQESGTTSDFPNYLHENIVKPKFFEAFGEAQSQWRRIASTMPLPDFKEMTTVGLGELPDLEEILEDDDYSDSAIGELEGPSIQLGTFGKTFSLSRKTMVNDDYGKLARVPQIMGRAANRTLSKKVIAVLTSNPNAYDGTALFHASHGNLGASALAEATLAAAMTAIETQTNQNGERTVLTPQILYVPAQLRFTAARILNSTTVPQPGTGLGGANVMASLLETVVEPFLSDANDWYVFANPADAASVNVGFLNGKEDPTLMLEQGPQMIGAGAYDPYELMVDKLTWKVRHDWATAAGEWRGAYKAVVA